MGTWGSGNLESDGALDYLSELSDALGKRIWEALQSKESTEADECAYDALFVDLEWLLTLEAADRFNGWGLPPAAEVDHALAEWITAWAVYFDGLAGPDFKAERLGVIEESFDRFRAVCAKYEQLRAS